MVHITTPRISRLLPVAALSAALVTAAAACGSDKMPNGPSPPPSSSGVVGAGGASAAPQEAVGPPIPPVAGRTARLIAAAAPNPVPMSGAAITDAPVCAGVRNTWFYSQTLAETEGVDVTIRSVIDRIDGAVANDISGLSTVVRAYGGVTYRYRWCFTDTRPRVIQSTFSGVDSNGNPVSVVGPAVTLQPNASALPPVTITVTPNPVPFSGTPIANAAVCANVPNTWFYTMTLTETAGADLTLSSITDLINGSPFASDSTAPGLIRARDVVSYRYRWCFTAGNERTVQTTFAGVDGQNQPVSITSPVITLLSAPTSATLLQRPDGGGGVRIRR
jgi:hypothetical protein